MQRPFRLSSLRLVPLLILTAVFGPARPASAEFLYDTSINFPGVVVINTEFEVPSILTSTTTITSFISASSNLGTVTSEILAPEPGESCPSFPGPCVAVVSSPPGGGTFVTTLTFSTPLTSVGTYIATDIPGSLTISTVIPEPSSLPALLALSLGAAAFALGKRLRARGPASPAAS